MLQAIARFLGVAALLVEARGGNPAVVELMRYGAILTREGDDAREELERLTTRIEAMVDEGRDPTDVELAEVRARREELSERIRSVDLGDDEEAGS